MKLKSLKNTKVLVEFDELIDIISIDVIDNIDRVACEYGATRMAYNMWQFNSMKDAELFIFMYRMKYENKTT